MGTEFQLPSHVVLLAELLAKRCLVKSEGLLVNIVPDAHAPT